MRRTTLITLLFWAADAAAMAAVSRGVTAKPASWFGGPSRDSTKQALISAIKPLQRGLTETPTDRENVEGLIKQLEKMSPTKKPLQSPLINGRWELIYTTSASILGRSRPAQLRPSGPIYQTIDVPNLAARNEETIAPLPFVRFKNAVDAALTPVSDRFVNVQFKKFQLGPLKFDAPESAKGALDTTYLDANMRVARGDKGNVFILIK
ncbi:unnamed protein product [Phaeothamnion confervicola]